ncbi:phage tailspike protein [Yersinia mollaretii]
MILFPIYWSPTAGTIAIFLEDKDGSRVLVAQPLIINADG